MAVCLALGENEPMSEFARLSQKKEWGYLGGRCDLVVSRSVLSSTGGEGGGVAVADGFDGDHGIDAGGGGE